MALIRLSGTIADIRGKIGGSVFFNTGGGLAMRNLTIPVNRNTIKQSNQRSIINDLQSQWQQLTNCQRKNWKLYIDLFPIEKRNFNKLPINAQQAFIKINAPFKLYGHSIITNPVLTPSSLNPVTFTITLAGAVLSLNSSRIFDNTQEFIKLLCTYPVPITVNNPGTTYKSIIFPTLNQAIHDITAPYTAIFGRIPAVGEKIFSQVNNMFMIISCML